ncbi:raffinose/stachyose/melibiose transport system substrate-binding protein [Salirhabdus euzebyi]|uniref:Raffinose/stachyose/melibiose transport system substrate-binding protein n=1 Tax=Salirhabdus euzebyi TaxID=394506 RepID=A0A841Q4E4_9BACI|nr:extracellular solute-binding protein [Salirhabdus euzebyi]MBB6453233.1 raffinose/stachyose/melibiose transport system substrate-binding protein [Salirhabdus euzebyi]
MKFRKSLLLLLSIAVALVLAACNGGGDDNNNEEGQEGDGQKITIFQSKVEISEALEALATEYEEETGVEVEVIGTTGDDYFQQLQIKLNSNQGPSIFSVRHITEAEKLQSYLHDMSGAEFVEHVAPNMALEYDGKIVGVPYGVEGFGLVYNKDLINPEDVATQEGFVETLESFNGTDVAGLSLAQEAYFLIGHISNYPFSLQEDNYAYVQSLNNGETTMSETAEFQAFGDLMEDIRANIPSPLDISYDEQIGDFATGKTAMIHQGNWAYGMFADYDLDFEIGMLPFPLLDNDKLAVGVGSNWAVNGTKDEAEVQAATDFLNWMHTSETGQRYIVEEFGFVPAFTNIAAENLDPLSQAVLDATNAGQTIPWSHNYYPANLVVNDFTPAAQNFFLTEDVTGEEFIESLDAAWDNATK